jgi:hypothetical protein
MGRFSNLTLGKGKEVTIGDEKFEIKPLTGKHMGLFMELGDEKTKNEAANKLILYSLKEADNTITDEDVNELPLNELSKLMEVILEVNELTE